MQTTANKIINRIYHKRRGWCFTPKNFDDLGSPEAIRISLHRLEKKGTIRRLARGIYDYPKKHPSIGLLSPSPQKIAKAIEIRDAIRIQESGAYAANMLGLTEQVPAKIVYLTDGTRRQIKIGNQEIELKKTAPRNLALNGRPGGALIHALKHLGNGKVTQHHIAHLAKTFDGNTKAQLQKDKSYAPRWMHSVIDGIVGDSGAGIR